MMLLLPLLPLLAAGLILGTRRPGLAGWINLAAILGALFLLLGIGTPAPVHVRWFAVDRLELTLGLGLDGLSRLLVWLVTGVGTLVSLYAVRYMRDDPDRVRFFAAFAFFLSAMLTLVMSTSTLLLYGAWEAVGLASYLLIGFWYTRPEAVRAARRAFLLTRLGDLGLLLGWLLAWRLTGSTEFSRLLLAVDGWPPATVTLLALLFLAGAAGKSAQLPLTAWLPDAMAGPTPVSALLHSATMVAAGVYLLLRLEPLYAASPTVLAVVAALGGLTAVVAALAATTQTDLKRVLAWSTVSQLGEMFLAFGLGAPLAAAQHLMTHALFKSALFLTAGAVEHVAGTRDLTRLGGLAGRSPWTAVAFVAGGLTLSGLPPFGAFWSEDEILRAALRHGVWPALLLLGLVFLAGVYISRAAVATFWRPEAAPRQGEAVPLAMLLPALLLAALGMGAGLFAGPLRASLGFAADSASPWPWMLAAVLSSLLGLLLGGARTWQRGAAPTFGPWAALPAALLDTLTRGAGRLTFRVARTLRRAETGLDLASRQTGRQATSLAGRIQGSEAALDAAGRGTVAATLHLAHGTEQAEQGGFSAGGAALAHGIDRLGGWARRLETGKLYLYTLALFVAVLLGAGGWLLRLL